MARRNIEDIYPLSPMQKGMMFHSLSDPGSGTYVEQMQIRIDDLDVETFRQAWERAVARHAALRASVVGTGRKEPVQVVRKQVDLPWTEHDCRSMSADQQKSWLAEFLREDRERGFDLDEPTLVRLALVRTGDRTWEFVWTVHHIVLDGWSGPLVLREVIKTYDALRGGAEPDLPPVRPFRDYITWLHNQDPSLAEAYWRKRLAGFTQPTVLAADRGGSSGAAVVDYDEEQLRLTVDETAALRRRAAESRVTLNTVVQAAWSLLLGRYSGEDDVVFGTVVSCRPDEVAGADTMVGMFVNTLPFRASLPPEETIENWLRSMQDDIAVQNQFEYSPLWDVQRWSATAPGTRLFESVYVFENQPVTGSHVRAGSSLSMRFAPMSSRIGYPLMLLVVPSDELVLRATYDAVRYERETVRRLLGHLRRVLGHMAAHPSARLSDIDLLARDERERVVVEWNRTEEDHPTDACLHELFERRVDESPDDLALIAGDVRLTYRQLDVDANRMAAHLRGLGVGPDAPVAICLDRSPEMVTAILAVLKAGGAYVPLDPAYPAERLAYVLENSLAKVMITRGDSGDRLRLPEGGDGTPTVLRLDLDATTIASCPSARPSTGVRPDHLAYVLYTSGSTGRPKGVAMPHAPLVNLMHWQDRRSAAGRGTRTLHFAPFSFDVSCQELFSTLGSGGTLVLATEDQRIDPEALLELLQSRGVERAFMPYVALQRLSEVAIGTDRIPMKLTEVITAGEQLQVTPAVASFFERIPGSTLDNQYGPTECHVVSALRLSGTPREWPALPGIGRPISNVRLYVLDERRQPVPEGVPGELYIGGEALARGYLYDDDLTSKRFMRDPFVDSEDARVYRTGDLASFEPDGNIRFLGRIDDQVKLRGFRVELGEVESRLSEHPDVRQAVAVIREDRPGDRRLVAYTVPEPGRIVAAGQLRQFLAERLPDYMIPAAFASVDGVPLTPSGKVHREALLAAEYAPLEVREHYVAPRGPVEEALVEVWSEVLGVHGPGIHDDFFELGGHSLMATQLVSRVRDALRVELPLRALFDHPTVAELASEIERLRDEGAEIPDLVPRPRDEAPPLSFSQQRLWFLDQLGAGAAYNMPWAFRLKGELDVAALEHSINSVIERHEVLRTRFPAVDGKPVQEILEHLEVPLRKVDLDSVDPADHESELARMYGVEALQTFDLARGPLIRPTLVRLSDDDHVLFLSIHHVIFDGWSIGVLNHELMAHYLRFTGGDAPSLPDLPVQYSDFSAWQGSWMQGEMLERYLDHWRDKLQGVSVLELPTDRPRPAIQTYNGAAHPLAIPADLTRALKVLGQRRGVTLAMTLMAAYKTLLHRYSGQDDIVVGAPIANRGRSEIENLVGFFVNSLVLRTDLSGDPTFVELLTRVQETALAAYEHQDLPFERLVDELHPQRDQSQNPLFQVVFAMQNAPGEALVLPGLEIRPFDAGARTTRFDIELHLRDTPDGVAGGFCYNTDLFDADTIGRMGTHFLALLSAIAARPESPLSELTMLPDDEKETLLARWNDVSTSYPVDGCLHTLFEEQVARTPDAVALTFENQSLTYRELNARANRLAHALRTRGVGPDVLVGLCVERSVEMVVGILGILKAGGAYVPLDLANPTDRIAFILNDTAVRVLVTESGQLDMIPEHSAEVICLDREGDVTDTANDENPDSGVGTDNLAYVIYTSGSTGKPKGVLVEHGSAVRLFSATEEWFRFDSADVWTLFHSCSFDFSVWEIWGALLNGGRLVVVPYWVSRSPEEFYELLAGERVTVLNQTPSAFRQLMGADEALHDRHDLALRFVIFGGEALDLRSLEPWFDRHGDTEPRLVNMYGITETTVHVTYRPLTAADARSATGSLIGVPIPDLQVYVLDAHMQPVPIGVPGEMYVGGAGVARGYLDRPELTDERFVPDPFRHEPDARLYRTGDVARYLPNRDLEYLGRNDDQVKIRAFRIELGEIEAALAAHPWVREAVVAAHDEEDGRRLVGYVVADREGASAEEDQLVDQWQSLYDETYRQDAPESDPTFNIVGWNSSYTAEPIPREEMQEWVDETVARILAAPTGRVLEIGCGTGLLLFRVAPGSEHYTGTDFSGVALDYVSRSLSKIDGLEDKVDLARGPADELDLEPRSHDTVVINSVIQYFPSIQYLLEVVERAVESVAPGGRVIIGDIRNLRVLEAYHASVQLYQAEPDLPCEELRQRVRQHLAQEEELVVDPAFFLALAHHLPRVSHVEIEPKRGTALNELTKFRYEVILHVEAEPTVADDIEWVDASTTPVGVENLRRRLQAEQPAALGVRGLLNTRTLIDELAARTLLDGEDRGGAAEDLRNDITRECAGRGIDPAELSALEKELPYRVELSWASPAEDGRFDVLFTRQDTPTQKIPMPRMQPQPWSHYANHPLQAKMTRQMAPKLRDSLEQNLPSYMVPSAFVMLESLPLTPNGKVDRRALPRPEWYLTQRRGAYVGPKTPSQTRICEIWAELLGVDQVGISDNFFDLGGHSLLATQVLSRVRDAFGIDLQLRELFDMPTVEEFAEHVERLSWVQQGRSDADATETTGREEGTL